MNQQPSASEKQEDPWTVGRLLTWTTDYLKKNEAENARLDAEVLLAEACGCERIDLYTRFAEEATEEVRTAFRELVRRRAEGTPVAYLVGRREFYSMSFRVTPDVLIPRPETETLVVELLDVVKESNQSGAKRILDVGTGSGILAVCSAKFVEDAHVTAVDVSDAALEIAKYNAEKHNLADRIKFLKSDLLEAVGDDSEFDFILSNPPYVSDSEYLELDPGVREFEPKLALVGGPTGTELYQRLVPQALESLNSGGYLFMEVSPMIAAEVANIATAAGFKDTRTVKDMAGLERVIIGRKP